MTETNIDRQRLITEWFLHDWIEDCDHLPNSKDAFIFVKTLFDAVALFGKITDQQRKYILGRGAILGMTDALLDELQNYEPDLSGDMEDFNRPHIKKTRMGIIYNLFRMFTDENQLDGKILEIFAKKLGVTKEQVQQLADLCEEERRIRRVRASLLFPFPHGFQDVLTEYHKLY